MQKKHQELFILSLDHFVDFIDRSLMLNISSIKCHLLKYQGIDIQEKAKFISLKYLKVCYFCNYLMNRML